MDKKIIIIIVIVIIAIVAVGCYFTNSAESDSPEISENTFLFNFENEPITNWNENTHEYKFHQRVTIDNDKDLKNIGLDVIFYNQGKKLDIKTNNINKIENGAFDLDFSVKLDSEPDAFYYNVTDVNWS